MDLVLTNWRCVAPIDHRDPVARTRPWLGGVEFSETERLQLQAIIQDLPPAVSFEDFLSGDLAFHERYTDEMAVASLEWWNVIERDGPAVCDLWLYLVDAGVIFRPGTNEVLGTMCQFHWDPRIDDEDLGPALERARVAALQLEPSSALRRYRFA
jgi:hypothetical protein